MGEVYEAWKKKTEKAFNDIERFKPAIAIKRCPKCHELSLEFDLKSGRVYCTRCNFEEHFPRIEEKK